MAIGIRSALAAAYATRISETGIAGAATVTFVKETGIMVNDDPQIKITVRVSIPGRQDYDATRTEIVPLVAMSRLTSGIQLPVKVDPENQSKIIIQW